MRFRSVILASVSLALTAPAFGQVPTPTTVDRAPEIPLGIDPLAYDLTIDPDAKAGTFQGDVTIDIRVTKPSRSVTLNSLNLRIDAVEIRTSAGAALPSPAITTDPARQTATFTLKRSLGAGRYRLRLRYAGQINTHSSGLFALPYKGSDGADRVALFTQFETSDARTVLPSWDEPGRKARFTLHLVIPDAETAVSNMRVVDRRPEPGGRTVISFEPTPPMSPYLLFMAIGDLERASRIVDGVDIGVVTRRGYLPQADFALAEAAKVLPWYNDYFGTRFPLAKLDNVAGPGESQTFGAMENWGAIFSFERSFLLDPSSASERQRTGIFATLAHEMAHQWFGDLVTMKWWSDLWLNESFASWMETESIRHFHPEWRRDLEMVSYRDQAMSFDALPSSHPIIQTVRTPDEASQAFDAITYLKGMAVIDMLESTVGPDAWRDGIRRYIADHKYGNATSDDLWRSLAPKAGPWLVQTAHAFTLQQGVPLIEVSSSCRAGNRVVELTQGEFRREAAGRPARHWLTPVSLATLDGKAADLLVDGHAESTLAGCGPVVVNAGQKGYFRTLYAPQDFRALEEAFGSLAPVDQLGLLTDAYALGIVGRQPLSDSLSLIEHLPPDASSPLVQAGLTIWEHLHKMAAGDAGVTRDLDAFARRKFVPVLDRLGWSARPGETPNDEKLRGLLVEKLGQAGVAGVPEEALRKLRAELSGGPAIDPSIRKAVFHAVAANADRQVWDTLHDLARKAGSLQERETIYTAMGMVRDDALAEEALKLALSGEPGTSVGPEMIEGVAVFHPARAIDFAIGNYDRILPALDSLSRTTFIPALADGSADEAALSRLATYRSEVAAKGGATGSADSAIADLRSNLAARETNLPALRGYFARPKP